MRRPDRRQVRNCLSKFADVTQMARVPAFQAGCHGFEPRYPLQKNDYVAQSVERLAVNQRVVGSIPPVIAMQM